VSHHFPFWGLSGFLSTMIAEPAHYFVRVHSLKRERLVFGARRSPSGGDCHPVRECVKGIVPTASGPASFARYPARQKGQLPFVIMLPEVQHRSLNGRRPALRPNPSHTLPYAQA
jgi:hypothetical protein